MASAKLLTGNRPLSALFLRASCHQSKPVSVGACLAPNRSQPHSRFGHTPISPLLVTAKRTSLNYPIPALLNFGKVSKDFGYPGNVRSKPSYNPFVGLYRRNQQQFQHSNQITISYNCFRNLLISALGGLTTLVAAVYLSHVEIIPYSNMTHMVLLPRWVDKVLDEIDCEDLLEGYVDKILPGTHPSTQRVTLIAEKIVDAFERSVRDKKAWRGPNYALLSCKEALKSLWHGKKFIDECNEINWLVVVVDDPEINAECSPDGLIVVNTGLLDHFKSDAEIAAIIGHEVTHVVARHYVEIIAKRIEVDIPRLFWNNFVLDDVLEKISTVDHSKHQLPLSRKQELEADRTAVFLMASAGYDPRVALAVEEKFAELKGDREHPTDYLSTHPCRKMRLEVVEQALEEAMVFYKERISSLNNIKDC